MQTVANTDDEAKLQVAVSRASAGSAITPGAVSVPGSLHSDRGNEAVILEVISSPEDDPEDNIEPVKGNEIEIQRERAAIETDTHIVATPIPALVVAQPLHVTIDEQIPDPESSDNGEDAREHSTANLSYNESKDTLVPWWKRRTVLYVIIFGLVVLLALVLGFTIADREESKKFSPKDEINDSGDNGYNIPDYLCYTSTEDLLVAQINDVNATTDLFIICPDTTIEIGVMENPADLKFNFIGGDYPLAIVHSHTTIQCGLNGRAENNCTLKNGVLQVLQQADLILPSQDLYNLQKSYMDKSRTLHNATFRGITFSGLIENSGPFDGLSVMVSQSGDTLFEDCHWKDITTSYSVFAVTRNDYMKATEIPLPRGSLSVTVRESSFTNIVFDNPITLAVDQNLTLDRVRFNNIRPSLLPKLRCTFPYNDTSFSVDGCAGILYCGGTASCRLQNSCITQTRTTGPSLFFLTHDTTEGSVSGNYLADFSEDDCQMAIGTASPSELTGNIGDQYICQPIADAAFCGL